MVRIHHALDDTAYTRNELRFVNDDVRKLLQKRQIRLRIGENGQIVLIFTGEHKVTLSLRELIEERALADLSWPKNDFSAAGKTRRYKLLLQGSRYVWKIEHFGIVIPNYLTF